MSFFTVQFPPCSCYLLSLKYKFALNQHIFKHPQSILTFGFLDLVHCLVFPTEHCFSETGYFRSHMERYSGAISLLSVRRR
jgi:hypothetical protein